MESGVIGEEMVQEMSPRDPEEIHSFSASFFLLLLHEEVEAQLRPRTV